MKIPRWQDIEKREDLDQLREWYKFQKAKDDEELREYQDLELRIHRLKEELEQAQDQRRQSSYNIRMGCVVLSKLMSDRIGELVCRELIE